MRNKFKLKGEKIFIENNLSWEKRKIQEKINRQIKKQREKSLQVKVGLARVWVKGVWRTQAEMEREDQERVNRRTGKDIEAMEKEGEGGVGVRKHRILFKSRRGYGGEEGEGQRERGNEGKSTGI